MNFYILLVIVLFLSVVNCQLEFPLKRAKSGRQFLFEKGVTEEHLKFLKPPYANDSVALFKYLDTDYYAIIRVGSPGQEFKVSIDTAWANSWIPSKFCPLIYPACWLRNKYDSTRSSSYQKDGTPFIVHEDTGDIEGFLSTDKINMGHLNVINQTFAEVTKIPWLNMFTQLDGILGFAFDSLAIDNVSPIFYNILKQKLIKYPLFSIYLNRDKTTEHAGVLLLGAASSKHYFNETLFYVPVTKPLYWQFKLTRIFVYTGKQSFPFCSNTCEAIIDSSNTVISGPPKEVNSINTLMGATKVYMGRYQVACNLVPKLYNTTFVIGTTKFRLHGRDLVQKLSYMGFDICLSVFMPANTTDVNYNTWVLGGAFLQRAFVIFDLAKQRLGFAKIR